MAWSGGHIVARCLQDLGIDIVFSVSGNQLLPIYDGACETGLRIVHTRHESAAVYAALAFSEVTGRPGAAMVSAGPGFLAGFTGLSTARFAELPVLYLSGDSPLQGRGTGNFQEFPQAAAAGSLCKASIEAAGPDSIPEALAIAWRLSQSGVPGPVHVSFPADVLKGTTGYTPPRSEAVSVEAGDSDILVQMAERLSAARRPAVFARPSAARGSTGIWLDRLSKALGVPAIIAEAPRGLNDLKYMHLIPVYRDADCTLVIGPSDFSLGFLSPETIARSGALLQVDSEEDWRHFRRPDLHARIPAASALAAIVGRLRDSPPDPDWTSRWTFPAADFSIPEPPDGIHPLHVAGCIRDQLKPQDVIVLDGGEFCQWVRLGLRDVPNRILWNSKFGGIGGAIPMALGAAAAMGPAGTAYAVLGDGCAGYHQSEFETAARYGIRFVAVIGNDARWGAEWHIQAQRYGQDRTYETSLTAARYDLAAVAMGVHGRYCTTKSQLESALAGARAPDKAVCINAITASVPSPARAM